jgi:dipeptidyl aminopeptidase/acylaminoacyl peptidase
MRVEDSASSTGRALSPRYGRGCLFYVSPAGDADTIWRLDGDVATPIWSSPGARIAGGLSVAPDGRRVAFSVERQGATRLHVIDADGRQVRALADSLRVRGAPAWSPDGRSVTVAAEQDGGERLFTVPAAGGAAVQVSREYAVDPSWSPDGRFVVYSGPDIGTSVRVGAVATDGRSVSLPDISLERGGAVRFLPGHRALMVLRGEIQHKDVWLIDLDTGAERPLTSLPPEFLIRDFDASGDGRELIVDRVEEHSNIVLLDLPRR